MSDSPVQIAAATAVGNLEVLEPLMLRIFGAGSSRPAGWFARKLHRECADPALSRIAYLGNDPRDRSGWIGAVIVGTPASLVPTARTLGVGVAPSHRGHGVGRTLLRATLGGLQSTQWSRLRIPADERAAGFFEAAHFTTIAREVTLLGFGTGRRPAQRQPARPWQRTDAALHHGWLVEAWSRTPESDRFCLHGERAQLDISIEGAAWLVHRVVAPAGTLLSHILDGLLDQAPAGTPVLVLGMDPVSSVTDELVSGRWVVAQRSRQVERAVHDSHEPSRSNPGQPLDNDGASRQDGARLPGRSREMRG